MSNRRVILRSLVIEEKIQESKLEQEVQVQSINFEERVDDVMTVAEDPESIVEVMEEKTKKKSSFKKKKEEINTL